jgi:hypothetical protein
MIINCLYGYYSYTAIIKNIFQKKCEHQDHGTKVYHQEEETEKKRNLYMLFREDSVIGDEA